MKSASTSVVCFGLVAAFSCYSMACVPHLPPPELYTPTFSYTPTPDKLGEGISIGLVKPSYPDEKPGEGAAPRAEVERSMLAYFTAHGFSISGPYDSIDAMTFPEKKQADLILTTDMNFKYTFPQMVKEQHVDIIATGAVWYTYEASGNCGVSGVVTFTLWEPLSKQRMWTKDVQVPSDVVDCSVEKSKDVNYATGIWTNACLQLAEKIFTETMRQTERYFVPEEVQLLKKQAQELRENKVY